MKTPMMLLLVLIASASYAPAGEEGTNMLDRIRPGEYWYGMYSTDGKPQGYCRLALTRGEDGGLAVEWELKITYPGGNYEEERSMALDAEGRLVSSAYRAGGEPVCEGHREGDRFVGTVQKKGKPAPLDVELPADAGCGMSFVLAPAVPREKGGRIAFTELDESDGFKVVGPAEVVWTGRDEMGFDGERLSVHKVEVRKESGRSLPLWITEDGRIAKADWGGGNMMVLSTKPTKDLYKPEPPALTVVETGKDTLRLEGTLAKYTPEEIYDRFTKPELLKEFWPQEAEVEPKEGGSYVLSWPKMGWTLRGTVKEAKRGEVLSFTWNWDHQPKLPERTVTIRTVKAEGGGTKVTIEQGPYGDTDIEQYDRKGHIEGWIYVFGKLRALK